MKIYSVEKNFRLTFAWQFLDLDDVLWDVMMMMCCRCCVLCPTWAKIVMRHSQVKFLCVFLTPLTSSAILQCWPSEATSAKLDFENATNSKTTSPLPPTFAASPFSAFEPALLYDPTFPLCLIKSAKKSKFRWLIRFMFAVRKVINGAESIAMMLRLLLVLGEAFKEFRA